MKRTETRWMSEKNKEEKRMKKILMGVSRFPVVKKESILFAMWK